jgi:hypothetical protein
LKDVFFLKIILKIKQWFKGAFVALNSVVGPNDIILVTFSNDILDIHVILSSIMDALWMKNYNEKTMLSFYYHIIIY